MAGWVDLCRFYATTGGTTDWTYSSAVTGCQSPAAAGIVNGRLYKYNAQSSDQTQWEIGEGAYNTGTGLLARTTVLYNSSGTGTASGQSGAGTKINFAAAPRVGIVALAEDLIGIDQPNAFSTAQKQQAQSNIYVGPTTQVFTSGSGTYTTPTGCLWIEVELVGGGGGGAGSGTSPGNGGSGGATTFGAGPLLSSGTATGGGGNLGGSGGVPSGGDVNLTGGAGSNGSGLTASRGGDGGISFFGGAGAGGAEGAGAGIAGVTNTGSGGGGGGVNTTVNGGGGGGAGGYVRKLITSPSATYSYAVGAAGTAGATGTSGAAGAAGGSGIIIVREYYGS